jgi:8-oxo-dGTP diphosphatase
VREIAEELGCQLDIVRSLPRFRHDYSVVVIEMIPFVCRLAPESPAVDPREHLAVKWVSAESLSDLDLAPADFPVVTSYRSSAGALDTPASPG